jgi:hypothetical protein
MAYTTATFKCMECNKTHSTYPRINQCAKCGMDLCNACYRKRLHLCIWCYQHVPKQYLWMDKYAVISLIIAPIIVLFLPAPMPIVVFIGKNSAIFGFIALYIFLGLIFGGILRANVQKRMVKAIPSDVIDREFEASKLSARKAMAPAQQSSVIPASPMLAPVNVQSSMDTTYVVPATTGVQHEVVTRNAVVHEPSLIFSIDQPSDEGVKSSNDDEFIAGQSSGPSSNVQDISDQQETSSNKEAIDWIEAQLISDIKDEGNIEAQAQSGSKGYPESPAVEIPFVPSESGINQEEGVRFEPGSPEKSPSNTPMANGPIANNAQSRQEVTPELELGLETLNFIQDKAPAEPVIEPPLEDHVNSQNVSQAETTIVHKTLVEPNTEQSSLGNDTSTVPQDLLNGMIVTTCPNCQGRFYGTPGIANICSVCGFTVDM